MIEPEAPDTPWRLDTLDALEYMARNLSDQEREIMALRFSGSQSKEISKIVGLCRERVRQIIEAVKSKMRIQYDISMAG
ncbi:MAG TPA: sigma factor-like helix-turn-helix DNA-binding protein [Sedimentisphaerales bacterium]|nr:sigma factor-like helix-turn-helix DNA-binding protein [Sedimentisphaerales bacterium]